MPVNNILNSLTTSLTLDWFSWLSTLTNDLIKCCYLFILAISAILCSLLSYVFQTFSLSFFI